MSPGHITGTVSGEDGGRAGGGLPYHFLKIEKIALLIWKNALIVFIHRLMFIYALIQNAILRVLRKKTARLSLMCRR